MMALMQRSLLRIFCFAHLNTLFILDAFLDSRFIFRWNIRAKSALRCESFCRPIRASRAMNSDVSRFQTARAAQRVGNSAFGGLSAQQPAEMNTLITTVCECKRAARNLWRLCHFNFSQNQNYIAETRSIANRAPLLRAVSDIRAGERTPSFVLFFICIFAAASGERSVFQRVLRTRVVICGSEL